MDYKNTLNLPKTNFSMKANLTHLEPNLLCYWDNLNIYGKLRAARKGHKKYILHDGPPYANGLIHIGHALNKILKDIVIRYKLLKDHDCPFIAGWDCHGLPVEHQLFKELKQTKHDVDIVDFRKKAREFALKFVEVQKNDFKRLGILSDWDNSYLTLNTEYEYGVMKLLEFLVAAGYVYRGRKPVNWCATCETALAEAEVEYSDKQSDSIYFLFKVTEDKGLFSEGKDTYFVVWTTTPWTIISNSAVAVHPGLEYCLVEYDAKHLVLGRDLIPVLQKIIGAEFKVINTYKGIDLEFLQLKHPFLERHSPVVLADFVSRQDGSGCVHIAPGHGEEDFSLTRKYNLPVAMPVNDKGIFEEPGIFKGMNIKQANAEVLNQLQEKTMLLKAEKINHSYPHCWRCKNPVIFRATFQWFLNIEHNNLRQKLLKEIDKVKWIPAGGRERMEGMLLQRPDWCLSRQRLWGIPIPAVKCKTCSEVVLDKIVAAKVADIFKEKGSDSWWTLDLKEFLPSGFSCKKCNGRDFVKEFDILDVWFESGASFLAVVKNNPELEFPADLYLEGSDQHRGWFQVSLIPSVAKENGSPFNAILTHGFVVDSEGRKMSKSLGNVVAPQEIIKKYGAEILRLWVAYTDYSEDVKISEDIIKQLVDIYRKVRNTIRFILGNIRDFDVAAHSPSYEKLTEVDKYMLSRTMRVMEETLLDYEDFSFYKVCQKIFNFCNQDLSAFYLDILKDRLYTFPANSIERRSAQFVLYHILKVFLKIISPILTFTAEESYFAWEGLPERKETIFMCTFDEAYKAEWINEELMRDWGRIFHLRDAVYKEIENKREQAIIGSSLEAEVILKFNDVQYNFFARYKEALREVFIVSDVIIERSNLAAPESSAFFSRASVEVNKSSGEKCQRCWNWRKDVNKDPQSPQVCARCDRALKEFKNSDKTVQTT